MRRRLLPILTLLLAGACSDGGPVEVEPPRREVDLEALFQPATAAEIAEVEADWAARTAGAEAVVEEASANVGLGGLPARARVFSHRVDGHRHYGLVVVPEGGGGGALPVVVFAHPGDSGVGAADVAMAVALMGDAAADYVYVIPSFRSESLSFGSLEFVSDGPPSPWDRDVDDALALLDVALREVPRADAERIGVVGVSRGAGVALLMAARDSRIDAVVEVAGPTDFFGAWARDLVEATLDDAAPDLPGLSYLAERYILPLRDGALSVSEVRLEMARRSAALFAHRLPPVQIHHGTADAVVDVEQAHALARALEAVGGRAGDELHLYPGAGHDPFTLLAAGGRIVGFLKRVLASGVARGGG